MLVQVCDNVYQFDFLVLFVVFNKLGVIFVMVFLLVFRYYIDWMFFFLIWLLVGKYFCILEDEVVGE